MTYLRRCRSCNDHKELVNFSLYKGYKGQPMLSTNCRTCASQKAMAWDRSNRARRSELIREWTQKNRPAHAEKERRRSARIRSSVCSCCDRGSLKEFYRKTHAQGLTVDHIYPIARGGPHCLKNLQALTKSANSSKGARVENSN